MNIPTHEQMKTKENTLTKTTLTLLTALLLAPLSALHAEDAPKPVSAQPQRGLHVEADGTLTLAGKPFYGMGLCYYDGFLRTIRKAKYPSYTPALKRIAASKIPFIRVPFSGFWPNELKVYQTKPEQYFREMDLFVKT
ncbi:MAG: hypothetical protein ORN51_09065, partial [Akkermansiaceae bacterium]|nr:hypothetical protein [Akkermansiaceae bacterium]